MNPAEDFPGERTAIAIASELNWINVQAYDFTVSADATTGHAAVVRVSEATTPGSTAETYQRSLTGIMQRMRDAGVPENKQVYGIPMHGHGWTNVDRGRQNGLSMAGRSAASRFGTSVKDYRDIKRLRGYRTYIDAEANGSFRYDGWTFWSYDHRAVVQRKVDLIQQPGKLGGVFASDFAGDDNGELLRNMSTRYRP
jgi:GH18 family chitinase